MSLLSKSARFVLISLAFVLSACTKAPESTPPKPKTSALEPALQSGQTAVNSGSASGAHADDGIAWRKGDVDAAFASAKADNKPVFLYWGAVWCPPCNQVQATVFNRRDFIERSRYFVPVYLDGDTPSAQKLGARFKVSGYPTMILFKPDGSEITRIPGEVDAEQYMSVMAMGINGARPVKETLDAALGRAGKAGAPLSADDWRMLAWYAWGGEQDPLLPEAQVPATLTRLAQACPPAESGTATRLKLLALATAASAKGARPYEDKVAVAELERLLADDKLSRENFDIVVNLSGEIAGHVTQPRTSTRAALAQAWDARLDQLTGDRSLSTADRLGATAGRIALAQLDDKKAALPAPLLAKLRTEVAAADRATTDAYARQAVISAAAQTLEAAGLVREADEMLEAELTRSHSPYYYMLVLAHNAKKRGDSAGAIAWAEKAYAAADGGPATRLQWGTSYLAMLIELAPHDGARIEKVADRIIAELEPAPDTFYDRNLRRLERIGKDLVKWDKDKQHTASVERIRARLEVVCKTLPSADPARASCGNALRPATAAKA